MQVSGNSDTAAKGAEINGNGVNIGVRGGVINGSHDIANDKFIVVAAGSGDADIRIHSGRRGAVYDGQG